LRPNVIFGLSFAALRAMLWKGCNGAIAVSHDNKSEMFMATDIAADAVSNGLLLIGLFLPPLSLCCLLGWSLLGLWQAFKERRLRQRLLKSSPCCSCLYFAGFQGLSCAVNPCVALTDDSQHCLEFAPAPSQRCKEIRIELLEKSQFVEFPSQLSR